MTLHVPGNKDAGSFSKTWQNNFWQITLQIQKTLDTLIANFIGTENDINSKRAFLDHAREWFDLAAGTATTVSRKLGQRIVNVVGGDEQIIGAVLAFFRNRSAVAPRIKAGTGVSLTSKLGEITISSSGGTITVKELDDSPSVTVATLKVQNGTLTDNGSNVATLGWMEPLVDTTTPGSPALLFDAVTDDILMVGVS